MSEDLYVETRKKRNISPLSIPSKSKFYRDIWNIENGLTGRLDGCLISNSFILESTQLLINSMELFELGYFDCAYYSLRTTLELSTTNVFLSNMPIKEKNDYTSNWKTTSDEFPMQGKMLKDLSEKTSVFSEMREKIPDFFEDTYSLNKKLNKYVHKQGLQHFYSSMYSLCFTHYKEQFINDFLFFLKKCISVVSIMRLAIDPFPILLMDNEISYRYTCSVTEPYSESFVSEYIDDKTIKSYKTISLYKDHYNFLMKMEKKTEAVFNVAKYKIVERKHMNEILQKLQLLSKNDIVNVLIIYGCKKAVTVYIFDGILRYFTEKKTIRKKKSWSSLDFINFAKSSDRLNQPYDEAYISVFRFEDENYCIEHNEILTQEDVAKMKNTFFEEISKRRDVLKNIINISAELVS